MQKISLNDITVVIQGPTDNCSRILKNLSPNLKYIWSTWDDEPKNNLDLISNHIPVVASKKSIIHNPGNRNINYQCHTSELGIRNCNTPYVIKMRGDLLWTNLEELCLKVFEDINNKNSFAAFFSYKPQIQEVHDFVTFSTKENGIKLWSYRQTEPSYRSPEGQLCDHMCKLLNLGYNNMIKNMSFANIFMTENVVDCFCIKYNVSLGYQCNIDWGGIEQFPKKL